MEELSQLHEKFVVLHRCQRGVGQYFIGSLQANGNEPTLKKAYDVRDLAIWAVPEGGPYKGQLPSSDIVLESGDIIVAEGKAIIYRKIIPPNP